MNSFLVTVAVKLLLIATGETPSNHHDAPETSSQNASVEIFDTITNQPDSLEYVIKYKD